MCLILFAYESHPIYRLVFAANRDEFYDRRTRPFQFWQRFPDILAGKDLKGGGSWMGITRTGRFAAVTNYREPGRNKTGARSRGFLVLDFLSGKCSPMAYLERIRQKKDEFNGFNILAGNSLSLFYYSKRQGIITEISPGVYGLSNHFLDTPWPKVVRGKNLLRKEIFQNTTVSTDRLLHILRDDSTPPDHALPKTGVSFKWEKILSPIFVTSEIYGTRSSSVLLWGRDGTIEFTEIDFDGKGRTDRAITRNETRKFHFRIKTAPNTK